MGWEGGPRAPRPESLRRVGLTSGGALSRHLAASYTGPGRRGAWPALCSEPRAPDSPVLNNKPGHVWEEVADQDTCRGSVMPARLLQKPLRGTSSAPSFLPGPGPQPALHDLLSPAPNAGAAKRDRSLGHPRNLGPGRSPHPGHRRPLRPRNATAACLPHALRVTGLVPKGPPTAGAPRAGSGVRTPPQRLQAQRPGAAPCPLPFSAGNNRRPCFRPPPPFPAARQLQGRTGPHRPRAHGGRPGQEAGLGVRCPGNGSLEKQLLLPGSS